MEGSPVEQKQKEEERLNSTKLIAFAYDVGFAIIVPLVILALAGRFLDKKLNTSPVFLIIGLLVSLIFTFYSIYKKTKTFL